MDFSSAARTRRWSSLLLTTVTLLLLASTASAKRVIESTSLSTCMENSGLTANLFNVTFSPDDNVLKLIVKADSTIMGKVKAQVSVIAYGFKIMEQELDPCDTDGFSGMCPMSQAPLDIESNIPVDADAVSQVPDIAYKIPDLDGKARMVVLDESGKQVACVEAPLSNGQTVNQVAVSWTTAVITGIAIFASAVTSGLGHSSTAAHVAANALSLFGYFQAQAMVTMVAVPLPPLVSSWTQNYDWSFGIIRIDFMQDIFNWYIQATGGTPSDLFSQLDSVSVKVAKRSLEALSSVPYLMTRAAMYGFEEIPQLTKRSNNNAVSGTSELITVTGIERLSFKARIESTNFFMTGLAWFIVFWGAVAICVFCFKWLCEVFIKAGWLKTTQFTEFRSGWTTVLKGIMYRVVLIGFPQMAIICPWEWTKKDSPAAVVQAVFFFFSILGILGWACWRVLLIARRSANMDKELGPAYRLYADPQALNRWGFLYVPFRTPTYYFVVPSLAYMLIKALFIGLGQKAGTVQAVALVIIELSYLVVVSWLRPWLDKRTNIVNIAIQVLNFLNSIFLLVFSGIFNSPDMVAGVMGVIFFFINAIFALVLLILVLISSGYALFSKNPEVRYQPMQASMTALSTANVGKRSNSLRDLDGDNSVQNRNSQYSTSGVGSVPFGAGQHLGSAAPSPNPAQVPLPPSTAGSDSSAYGYQNSGGYAPSRAPSRSTVGRQASTRTYQSVPSVSSPSPRGYQYSPNPQQQQQHGQAPIDWQVGAGYDR